MTTEQEYSSCVAAESAAVAAANETGKDHTMWVKVDGCEAIYAVTMAGSGEPPNNGPWRPIDTAIPREITPAPDPVKADELRECKEALDWLAGDDTGISSKAILNAALGKPTTPSKDYHWHNEPYDPDDLGRCLRMLRLMPWAARGLAVLATHSGYWAVLVEHWVELEKTLAEEVGIYGDHGHVAQRTFAMIERLHKHPAKTPTGERR